jgi:hypothetical protein
MKKTGIVLIGVFLLFMAGCKKELLPCERDNWGTLKLVNTSSQEVRVYVDGEFTTDLITDSYVEVDYIPAGTHYIHAEQISLGQSWDNTIVILQCDRLNVAFTP